MQQPRVEYEFTPGQNQAVRTLASRMRWVGIFLIVIGALAAIFGVLSFAEPGLAVSTLIQAAIYVLIGVWTMNAARSFALIVETAGQDVANLMDALGSLRKLYTLQFWVFIAALILLVIGLLASLFGEPAVPAG